MTPELITTIAVAISTLLNGLMVILTTNANSRAAHSRAETADKTKLINGVLQQLEDAGKREQRANEAMARQQAQIQQLRNDVERVERDNLKAAAGYRTEIETQRTAHLEEIRQLQDGYDAQIRDLKSEIKARTGDISILQDEVRALKDDLEAEKTRSQSERDRRLAMERERDEAVARAKQVQEELSGHQRRLADMTTELGAVRSELNSAKERISRLEAEKRNEQDETPVISDGIAGSDDLAAGTSGERSGDDAGNSSGTA